jgi:hypothetical protein
MNDEEIVEFLGCWKTWHLSWLDFDNSLELLLGLEKILSYNKDQMTAIRLLCDLLVIASGWKHDIIDHNTGKENPNTNAFILLKKILDYKVGLHTLVFTRIPEKERAVVLDSIQKAAPPHKQELIILCDIDDTFMCSLLDRRYSSPSIRPRKEFSPFTNCLWCIFHTDTHTIWYTRACFSFIKN